VVKPGCGADFILDENGDCVLDEAKLADIWEDDICQTNEFISNTCAQNTWNLMKENNIGYEVLKEFLRESPIADLCLDISSDYSCGDNPDSNGRTSANLRTHEISISFNSLYITNASEISFVRTILHEMIHAELYRKIISVGGQISIHNYPGIYDFYRRYKDWSHNQMAEFYRDAIVEGLRSTT